MDQNLKEKTLENLTKAENILIAISANLSLDGLASGLALYLSLIKLGKKVSIFGPSPSVGDAQKIYGVDKIGKTLGKKDLVVVVGNAVQTVDKVTYFLEGNNLKVVIHSLSGSQGINKDQVSLEETQVFPEVIFALGFESLESLRSEITHAQKISPETWLVSINVAETQQKFAQVNIVNPEAASFSELTAKIIQDLALPMDEDIAYNLYMGIIKTTDNFLPNKVSSLSLEIAAWLIKFGAGKASLAAHSDMTTVAKRTELQFENTTAGGSKIDFFEKGSNIQELEGKQEHPEIVSSNEWLKPPKIYKGSKSFDREN